MTAAGTNSYLLGEGSVTVIDPGPDSPAHLQALLQALDPGERITHVLVTHSHADHSPLSRALSRATGAPVLALGDSLAGRSARMHALADAGDIGGGEGVDAAFAPDYAVADGEVLQLGRETVTALWTPGHFGNHMCFLWQGCAFSGDHVMGWASSLVSPPDGDLTDFMRSLDRLEEARPGVLYPGHGAPVSDGPARIRELRQHRLMREAQILDALRDGPTDSATLARRIYRDTPAALMPAAARNVLAHLLDLRARQRVISPSPPGRYTRFQLAPAP